ncbi:MAG: CHASE2 domain-containing protein, partial [Cyanobacteria bacterium P01_C01_bin.121]
MSGIVVAVISVGFSAAGAWRALELQSYNFLHQTQRELSGTPSWNEQIIVIAIDDASVEQLGHFPWPRQSYADLLEHLSGAQPAAVAFNILLPKETPQDEPLAQSIVGSANVILAVGSDLQGDYVDVAPTIASSAEGFFLRGDNGTHTDEDGVSRQMHLQGQEGVPSLGVATLQVYADSLLNTTSATSVPNHRRPHRSVFDRSPASFFDSQPASLISNQWVESIQPEALIQDLLPSSGPVWIRWPGEVSYPSIAKSTDQLSQQSPGALQVYSYADVVNGLVDTSHFQNKIVLVGPTLTGVDTLRTPFQTAEPTSGVYVYAATISNLLDQSFLRRPT